MINNIKNNIKLEADNNRSKNYKPIFFMKAKIKIINNI